MIGDLNSFDKEAIKDEKAILGPETGYTASFIFVSSRQETATELVVEEATAVSFLSQRIKVN
jgi:hypothetical protein